MTLHLQKTAVDVDTLTSALRGKFGEKVLRLDVHQRKDGAAGAVQNSDLWLEVTLASLRPVIEELFNYDQVSFHVMSGEDVGDTVALTYHLSLFQAVRQGRIGISLTVSVPKSALTVPSIFDLLPGSEYSEREMREMFGVDFEGLPNKALVFLPDDWNESVKPWRRDESGLKPTDVRELN